MTTVALESDARLSQLMERVDHGESITITKEGVAVAQLVPLPAEKKPQDLRAVIEKMIEFRKSHALDHDEFWSMIEEGRRHD